MTFAAAEVPAWRGQRGPGAGLRHRHDEHRGSEVAFGVRHFHLECGNLLPLAAFRFLFSFFAASVSARVLKRRRGETKGN